MTRRLLLAALALAVLFPLFAHAQGRPRPGTPSLFKLELGMDRETVSTIHPNWTPSVNGSSNDEKAKGAGRIEDYVSGDLHFVISTASIDGALESIHGEFKEANFQTVIDSLSGRYRRGKIKGSIIRNDAGTEFQQIESTWTFDKATLVLKRYGGDLYTSTVDLFSDTYREHLQNRDADKSKAAQDGR